jgi:hypothetical protein
MLASHDQNAGQNHDMNIANGSFEDMPLSNNRELLQQVKFDFGGN